MKIIEGAELIMIYLAGDIHGRLEVEKITDFFESETNVKTLTEEDYLILLGDVGLCWDNGKNDKFVREKLESLPVTTLWIDGNHENFNIIDALPTADWHGGKVQFIGKKIIHLMRGYVYQICGKNFFAFGGGFSIDKMFRREGISWWAGEMPSPEEYERGKENLKKADYKVDYIITHTAPTKIAHQLVSPVYPGEEMLQCYLQEHAVNIKFDKWYFGHWHKDCVIDNYVGLYDKIVYLEV